MTEPVALRIQSEDGKVRTVSALGGESILEAAHRAGVEIAATCGARGRCRSCRCKVLSGTLPPPAVADTVMLGHEAVRERFRLACQTKLIGDTTVQPVPPKSEAGYQILGTAGSTSSVALASGVEKIRISATAPVSEHHQTSDLEEVLSALGPALTSRVVTPDLVRDLPAKLRDKKGDLTATLFRGQLVDIEVGDTTASAFGIAFDIGTTSIVASLLDLTTGEELTSVGMVNPQAPFGADLMSRIAFAQFNPRTWRCYAARS